jgi:hypothetical protein
VKLGRIALSVGIGLVDIGLEELKDKTVFGIKAVDFGRYVMIGGSLFVDVLDELDVIKLGRAGKEFVEDVEAISLPLAMKSVKAMIPKGFLSFRVSVTPKPAPAPAPAPTPIYTPPSVSVTSY